jgi:integrase
MHCAALLVKHEVPEFGTRSPADLRTPWTAFINRVLFLTNRSRAFSWMSPWVTGTLNCLCDIEQMRMGVLEHLGIAQGPAWLFAAELREVAPARQVVLSRYNPEHDVAHRALAKIGWQGVQGQVWSTTSTGFVVLLVWLEQIAKETRKKDKREYTLSKTTLAHIKNFLSGVFRHAAQQGFFHEANPAKLAEIPAFAPKAKEGGAYSLDDIGQMVRLLPEPAAIVVTTAAYTGLRLGELQGLNWEDYTPPIDDDQLGSIEVRRSVWRGTIGEPKTERSKSPVPVISQLADKLAGFRLSAGNPDHGPIFANTVGKPMDLNALYYRHMRKPLATAGTRWLGWHGFRRGLASNLNRLGVDDSVIQAILRHNDVSVTQRCYIKTNRPDAIAAMRQLSVSLLEMEQRSRNLFRTPSDRQDGPDDLAVQ